MQYLIQVITADDGQATGDEMAAIDEFNQGLREADQLRLAIGLADPASSITLDNRDGRGLVTAGPFLESVEHVAGLWLIEVADEATALGLAAAGSRACHRRVELRRVL